MTDYSKFTATTMTHFFKEHLNLPEEIILSPVIYNTLTNDDKVTIGVLIKDDEGKVERKFNVTIDKVK